MTIPLEREAVVPRLDGIKKNIAKLRELGKLPFDQFSHGDAFDLAQHHLRLALEGIFHIGSHILSRLPGERAAAYAQIAENLGNAGIVTTEFAATKLVVMAGLRNLLVHHYADIDPGRIYDIVHEHLSDIEIFLREVKKLVEHPEKFGLTIS